MHKRQYFEIRNVFQIKILKKLKIKINSLIERVKNTIEVLEQKDVCIVKATVAHAQGLSVYTH